MSDPVSPADRARELGVPLVPRRPPTDTPLDPNPVISVCGECGLEVRRVMYYSCPNTRCPVFAKCTFGESALRSDLDAVATTGCKASVERWK